ncbi:hypothetical protein CEK77_07590 [Salmonella enterica]|nr:hypothetical protein [Salmonella enterica]MIN45172.1 hypothetical protein [Salmonella enterica]
MTQNSERSPGFTPVALVRVSVQSEVIRESLRLLREKQAESRLKTLRDLLAEGLSSGDPQTWAWKKDAFLQKVKSGIQ